MRESPTLADLATSPDGESIFFHFSGKITAFNFGEAAAPLFGLAGFNVRRRFEHEGAVYMLSREIAFYLDLKSGEVLKTWQNFKTGQIVAVPPLQNDPVNINLSKGSAVESLGDYWKYQMEVYPCYPLPGAQGILYTSGEHFQFLLNKEDWQKGNSDAVICTWSRTGPWLNWMQMGDTPGFLQYHASGRRLNSADQLPDWLLKEVSENHPHFLTAPTEFNPKQQNATSFNQ